MGYVAGVDLGTTYSAAAIVGPTGVVAVDLSSHSTVMPSVVAVRAGGEVLTGSNAERRLVSDPSGVAREFKRRLGDSTPLLLGGTPYAIADVTGYLLRSIVEVVTERQGEPPELVGLSHPANYGDFKLDLLEAAARTAGVAATTFVAEPVAAAVHYAQTERVGTGDVIAVYDLGGGTFDASVVRRTVDGFELIGTPDGMDRFGGIDLDEAVLGHVRRSVDGGLEDLDASDPAVMAALGRLREDCRDAKEALSGDAEVAIPVMLPGLHTEVRLTRPEFEGMIRPRMHETIDVLRRTISSAGIEVDEVSRVLLVGGSSRIPLIGEMVTQELGRPVGLDAHPKLTVALGTARIAAGDIPGHDTPDLPPIVAMGDTDESADLAGLAASAEAPTGPTAVVPDEPATEPLPTPPPVSVPGSAGPPVRRSRWPMIAGIGVIVLGLAAVVAVVVPTLGGDGDGDDDESTPASVATVDASEGVEVPSVNGREAVAARDALAATGLTVEVEFIEVSSNSADDGFVIAQSIPAGTSVEPGTGITIMVGRVAGSATTSVPASPTTQPTTTPPTTAPATTTTPPSSALPTAEDQLAAFFVEDEPRVVPLAEHWVPQLSAKRLGTEDGGIVYGYDEILADHRAHREQYDALLVDGGGYNFNLDGEQMVGWFMTIVPEPFTSAEGALDWCRLREIGRDDCFAKFLSADSENTDGTIKLQ